MASEQTSPKILLFPFLAHGHLNPFLELSKKLTKNNFLVYFCSTPVNLKIYEKKLAEYSVIPLEYHLESTPELPPHYHTTNGLPSHLMYPLIEALHKSAPTFSNILKTIQPDLVIHDINQKFIPHIPTLHGIPSIYYQIFGCASLGYHLHHMQLVKRPDLEFPSSAFFYRQYELELFEQTKPPAEYEHIDEDKGRLNCLEQSHEMTLIRSSRAIEGKYIDFQSVLVNKKVVPLGALVTEPKDEGLHADSEVIQWLNGKEEASVVYVSFGSQIFLSKDELKEMALGLEMSNANFIWVVRAPRGEETSLEEVLPEGFLERTKGRGFVEQVWAPQTQILKHPSTGAFLSHCGWGSVVESISLGVPIVAMAIQYDQPLNARLVVELGVGLEVVGDEKLWERDQIARTITEVLHKDTGKEIRRKCRELGGKMKVQSEEEIDVACKLLRGVCEKKKNQSS